MPAVATPALPSPRAWNWESRSPPAAPPAPAAAGPVGHAQRRAADGGEQDRERRQREPQEPPRQPAMADEGPGPGAENEGQQGGGDAEPLQQQVRAIGAGEADEIGGRGVACAVEGRVGRRIGDQRGAHEDGEAAERQPGNLAQPAGEECPRARRQERRARVACGVCYQLQPRGACPSEIEHRFHYRGLYSLAAEESKLRFWTQTKYMRPTAAMRPRTRLCATIRSPRPNAGASGHGHAQDPSPDNPRRLRGRGHRRRLARAAGAGPGGRADRKRARRTGAPGAALARSPLPHR